MDPTHTRTAELQIRRIDEADAEAVAALAQQLGYQRAPDQVRRWIAGLPDRAETQTAFVAVADVVVGWIEASIERRLQSEDFALIGGLVVKDGLRNLGIGARLCEHAEQWSSERGVSKIRVTSRSTREGAHRFYLRRGYEITKTSLVFEKPLDASLPQAHGSQEIGYHRNSG
jgi:GNAT superfamily N-acetyltransferase